MSFKDFSTFSSASLLAWQSGVGWAMFNRGPYDQRFCNIILNFGWLTMK